MLPKSRVFRQPAARQQLYVHGHFSDGSVRDITALTVFTSSNESVATVGKTGAVEKTGRGETAILARYLDKMETSFVTFLEDVEGFAWNDPAENNFVDTLAFEKLKTLQYLPSDLCTDEEFIRRAYLDTLGRLPRTDEAVAFLDDADPDKRIKLVDRLVDQPEFAGFWTLRWGDILRSNSKKLNATGVYKFRRWIYDSIYNDKPLDQFAEGTLNCFGQHVRKPGGQLLAGEPRPERCDRDDGSTVPRHPHPVCEVSQPSVRAMVSGQLLRHRGGVYAYRA